MAGRKIAFWIRIYFIALFLTPDTSSKKTKTEKSKYFLSKKEIEWEEAKQVNQCQWGMEACRQSDQSGKS
jgi:hypothetical protein